MIELKTNGNGLWSSEERTVSIKDMKIAYIDDEFAAGKHPTFGELRVYFDTKTWSTRKHGLIYTDKGFMRELREFLDSHGLVGKDVSYSEQGMQGNNYVSLDAGGKFLKSWGEKFSINWDATIRKQEQGARWG